MYKVLKHTLVAIVSLIGLYLLCLGVRGFLFADFFSGPSEKECIKTVEQFLGYKLGRKYEFLDYDADFSHPDRQLNFSIKIPSKKFKEIVGYCEREASKEKPKTEGTISLPALSREVIGDLKRLRKCFGEKIVSIFRDLM